MQKREKAQHDLRWEIKFESSKKNEKNSLFPMLQLKDFFVLHEKIISFKEKPWELNHNSKMKCQKQFKTFFAKIKKAFEMKKVLLKG